MSKEIVVDDLMIWVGVRKRQSLEVSVTHGCAFEEAEMSRRKICDEVVIEVSDEFFPQEAAHANKFAIKK